MAMLGLCCCLGFSLVAVSGGYSLVAVRILIVVVSLVAKHKLLGAWVSVAAHALSAVVAPGLQSPCSAVVVHRLIALRHVGFPDQESNPCLLHWQVDSASLILSPQLYIKCMSYKYFLPILSGLSFFFFNLDFISFQSSFRSTVKLREGTEIFPIYFLTPHAQAPLIISSPHESGTSVTMDKSTLILHHHHVKIIAFFRQFTVLLVHSMDLDKSITTHICHYGTIQRIFTVLKLPCALRIHPTLPTTFGNH